MTHDIDEDRPLNPGKLQAERDALLALLDAEAQRNVQVMEKLEASEARVAELEAERDETIHEWAKVTGHFTRLINSHPITKAIKEAYAKGYREGINAAAERAVDWANGELGDLGAWEAIRALLKG